MGVLLRIVFGLETTCNDTSWGTPSDSSRPLPGAIAILGLVRTMGLWAKADRPLLTAES
jgi:hypothetical protein